MKRCGCVTSLVHERAVRQALFSLLFALAVLVAPRTVAAGEPGWTWLTIETPMVSVHYHKDIEPIAQRVASLIEDLRVQMTRDLGWKLSQPLHIVIVDSTDSANGSATAFPYNTMRLFVTGPDDMSVLSDYDDWYVQLVSHEHMHIMQMDNIHGIPAVINAIIGRTISPNQAQPRWLLEGYSVIHESMFSTGGRMRSSMYDMFLRADVIDDRILTIDQMFNTPRRWPRGTAWYLYGSQFLSWIVDIYGYSLLSAIAIDTSDEIIPFGVNRHIYRFTGRTYEQLYPAWQQHIKKHYAAQLEPVFKRGLREGKRITFNGYEAHYPRFVPNKARTEPGYAELVYHSSTSFRKAGFYRLVFDSKTAVKPGSDTLYVRADGTASASFAPDGAMIYSATQPWRKQFWFHDLHRIEPGKTATAGTEKAIERLTFGNRALAPDVSPDGHRVVFTVNHHGTSYLRIADLTADNKLINARTLVPSARFDQAYTPRFSPDGTKVVYSVWTHGGNRDIRIVDVQTGKFRQLTSDRAVDMQPVFSPDGTYILFASDRTAISNIYAYHLPTDILYQVTNVRTGAYHPALSPDGETLVYVGYTSFGFDLWTMPFDPNRFLTPEPYIDDRPPSRMSPTYRNWKTKAYNPLPSLRPRAVSLDYGPGTYGQAFKIQAYGADAVGLHNINLMADFETEKLIPYASVQYAYNRLPFSFYSNLFSSVAPRKTNLLDETESRWHARTFGWTNGISVAMPSSYESQHFGLSYSIAHTFGKVPVGSVADPYAALQSRPVRGNVGVVRGSWSYSNTERYAGSIGTERGFTLSAFADIADLYTASDYFVYAFGYNTTGYIALPWMRHHTLALHLSGAVSTSNYPGRGLYFVGGFIDTTIQDVIKNTMFQGGFVLRGYDAGAFIGSQYHLANAEYRFPIATVDRGIATLPFYLQRVSGNLFIDYGGAFETLDVNDFGGQFHTGIGAELLVDLQIGYFGLFNTRFGYAKGFGQYAIPNGQLYFAVSAPF